MWFVVELLFKNEPRLAVPSPLETVCITHAKQEGMPKRILVLYPLEERDDPTGKVFRHLCLSKPTLQNSRVRHELDLSHAAIESIIDLDYRLVTRVHRRKKDYVRGHRRSGPGS